MLGLGDSLFLTGAMAWGVQLGGQKNAAKGLMSVGIALYAAMAIGAPLGVYIVDRYGFGVLGLFVAATPLLACAIANDCRRSPSSRASASRCARCSGASGGPAPASPWQASGSR